LPCYRIKKKIDKWTPPAYHQFSPFGENIPFYDQKLHSLFSLYLQNFFNSSAMGTVKDTFCIYHVTAPGQEAGADDLPEGFAYPTMDELSDQVR
jgi:hypothetical protein